jgi:fatty-acyl-CoA synthase
MDWMKDCSEEEKDAYRVRAGRVVYGVEMKIVDADYNALPWDGISSGLLLVKGPWVCNGYYRLGDQPALDDDGWFDTGDMASIDEYGYVVITDRVKDVIKSGGEWISSIDVENAAMSHEHVQEAAVIGVADPKWTERPLLIVIPSPGGLANKDDILASLEGKIAKWWIPGIVCLLKKFLTRQRVKLARKTYENNLKITRIKIIKLLSTKGDIYRFTRDMSNGGK